MPSYICPELLLIIISSRADTPTHTALSYVDCSLHINLQPRIKKLKIFILASVNLEKATLVSLAVTCKRVCDLVSLVVSIHQGVKDDLAEAYWRVTMSPPLTPMSWIRDSHARSLEAELDMRWERAVGGTADAYVPKRL